MWWGESGALRRDQALLLVLRADALDAGWMPAAAAVPALSWQTAQVPVVAAPSVAGAVGPAAWSDAAAGSVQLSVAAAFAGLRAVLLDPQHGPGSLPPRAIQVLLAGPCVGVVMLPWSDALLHDGAAETHVQAELQARGFDALPGDLLAIDGRPPLGRPRAVFWVPAWLALELSGLAAALGGHVASVQALHAVAAGWATRRERQALAGQVTGLLGSGTLQLLSSGGEVLADAMAGAPLPLRAAGLWQRARVRFPSLASATGLRVLTLDEAPPEVRAVPADPAAPIHWLAWPEGAQSRPALDRALMLEAQARPTAEAWQTGRTRAAAVWPAAALLCLVVAAGLALAAWQRQSDAQQVAEQAAGPTVPPRSTPPTRAELAELRAVNAAVRQINLPLPTLLRTLQPPRDLPVVLLGLDLAGQGADASASGPIKLSAEAPGGLDMTRYVGFLGARRGVSAAQLVRHEVDVSRPGGPYRFEVEITWQP